MRSLQIAPRVSRVSLTGLLGALASILLAGCRGSRRGDGTAGADGRRGRGEADERAGRGLAERDDPGAGERDDPGPRPRVPHRAALRRGGDGQEGAAPAGDRRGALQDRPPVGPGAAGRGRGVAPEIGGVEGAGGRVGPGRPRSGSARPCTDPGDEEPGARGQACGDGRGSRPDGGRPETLGVAGRGRPRPTSPRRGPITRSGSPRRRRRSRPPRPPCETPS